MLVPKREHLRDRPPHVGPSLAGRGWHELGDVSKIKPTRQAFKDAYSVAIPDSKPGTIPVSAGQIFRFVHEMQIDDIVVYPSRHDRMINIGRVTGTYEYVIDADEEYPHRRPAKWLQRVSRDEFSQNALYEVGAAMTLFRVTSNAEEFLSALTGEIARQPAEVDQKTAALIAEQFEESTEDFIIRQLKNAQSSYEFEHFVAHLLQCMGYHARVTKASGDAGVYVIAHRDELGFEPREGRIDVVAAGIETLRVLAPERDDAGVQLLGQPRRAIRDAGAIGVNGADDCDLHGAVRSRRAVRIAAGSSFKSQMIPAAASSLSA